MYMPHIGSFTIFPEFDVFAADPGFFFMRKIDRSCQITQMARTNSRIRKINEGIVFTVAGIDLTNISRYLTDDLSSRILCSNSAFRSGARSCFSNSYQAAMPPS